ncbi:Retrotransposon-like protein 1 [Merluccius polli]|uniref:Retrotransposon-like protein 1 n=1 Tax=Merluccius polli TaxID=89951 RepID=A0AA47M4E3_MERPO|nr:Retrotransposon-like protein 1 [Merluccius polli]
MDPAETERVRLALSSQGVRIGQHDADLQDVSRALSSLSTGMEQLGNRLEQMFARVSSLTAPTVPLGPAASSSHEPPAAVSVIPLFQPREPFIPTPLRYSGELGRCRQFLHQCDLVFEQQPLTYAGDRTKTAYVMSLLSGQASDWAVAISFNRPTLAGSYSEFIDNMRGVFDHPVQGKEASSRLLSLRQGADSVSQFALNFRILAVESGWDNTALQSVFLRGIGCGQVRAVAGGAGTYETHLILIIIWTPLSGRL